MSAADEIAVGITAMSGSSVLLADAGASATRLPPVPDELVLFRPPPDALVVLGGWSPSSPDDPHYIGSAHILYDGHDLLRLAPARLDEATPWRVAAPLTDERTCMGAEGEPATPSTIQIERGVESGPVAATDSVISDEDGRRFLTQVLAAEVFDCVGTSVEGQTCSRGQVLRRRLEIPP